MLRLFQLFPSRRKINCYELKSYTLKKSQKGSFTSKQIKIKRSYTSFNICQNFNLNQIVLKEIGRNNIHSLPIILSFYMYLFNVYLSVYLTYDLSYLSISILSLSIKNQIFKELRISKKYKAILSRNIVCIPEMFNTNI